MIITICLTILVYSILKRPLGWLANKLKGVDWKGLARDALEKIVLYSRKGGRAASRPLLKFYYALTEGDLTNTEKAFVYAGIIYIAVPSDLLPRRLLSLLGVIDDVAVAAWIYKTIGDGITPAINQKVEATLNNWFGPEIVSGVVADFNKAK